MNIQTPIDGFYEELMKRITTQVPGIKHFDLFADQYSETDDKGNYPFNCPAVFFEWPGKLDLTPLGLRRKQAVVPFKLHIVSEVVQEVSKRSNITLREKGHKHLENISLVQDAIEGFNGDQAEDFRQFGAISVVGIEPYTTIGNIQAHVLSGQCRIIFDAAKKYYIKLVDLEPPITADDTIQT